jgi:hypothetical protein
VLVNPFIKWCQISDFPKLFTANLQWNFSCCSSLLSLPSMSRQIPSFKLIPVPYFSSTSLMHSPESSYELFRLLPINEGKYLQSSVEAKGKGSMRNFLHLKSIRHLSYHVEDKNKANIQLPFFPSVNNPQMLHTNCDSNWRTFLCFLPFPP